MPFHATVFDHTRFVDGFDKEDRSVFVRDDLLFQIGMEEQGSWIIWTLENYLVNKVTAEGFSMEFSQAGRRYTITDMHQNRVMYIRWEEEIKRMLRHIIRYGFCAVRYVEIKGSKDEDRFVPRCMDPIAEYSVRFRINDDGTRDYVAYERNKIIQDKPIPNTRVFVAFDPEADGTINSPLQRCFSEIQRVRGYWERDEQKDFRNTHPLFIYEIDNSKDLLIPAGIPDEAVPEYNMNRGSTVANTTLEREQVASMRGYEIGDKFYQQQFQQEIQNGLPPEDLFRRTYDPLLRRFTDTPMPNPFKPEKLLSQNIKLSRGAPQPKSQPNFEKIIENLTRSISNCFGVPPDVLEGGKGQFSANVQFSTQQLNTTVQSYQRILERFIVIMYLDIYSDQHLSLINKVVTEMNRERIRRSSAEQKTGSERIEEKRDATDKTKESDSEEPPKSNKNKRSISDLIVSESERLEIEKSVVVEVHFNVNPSFDFDTLAKYAEKNIISHEDFQHIALKMAALPESMAMTPSQIDRQTEQEAKRQKILAPEPRQSASAAAPKRPGDQPKKPEAEKKKPQKATSKPADSTSKKDE